MQISGDRVWVRRGRNARVRAQWMLGQCREWKPAGRGGPAPSSGLERAWRRLPACDAAGSVCLLDLSIVRLHEGRLDAARNCLTVAQTLTGADRGPVGLAHLYEALGVLRSGYAVSRGGHCTIGSGR